MYNIYTALLASATKDEAGGKSACVIATQQFLDGSKWRSAAVVIPRRSPIICHLWPLQSHPQFSEHTLPSGESC